MIARIAKVRKRDGRLVDFDESKIADAIFKAACSVGGAERFLAEELAGVVTLFLEKRYAGTVPDIEEIQDMVERVLIETGHARMAKAYILYRERRARAREQVFVHARSGAGPLVGNPAKASTSAWSKGRIAEALVREADLDSKVAGRIAARVEEKVVASSVTRITTSAIRSLVEAELLLQGFGDRVGRQALVGLPRYDIARLVRGGDEASGWRASGPRELKRSLADAVLAQYALSEVYSAEVAEAHIDRRIHIADVGSPFEWLAACASPATAVDAEDWVERTALLVQRLAEVVTREILVGGLVGGAWCREPGRALAAARRLLAHPALPRGPGPGLILSLPLRDEGGLTEALVREHWARFRSGAIEGLPQLLLRLGVAEARGPEGRRVLLPALAAAAETGRIHFVFERDEAPRLATPWYCVPAADAGPGPALTVGGAVAINLCALEGPQEERLIEALDGALALALKALRQKRGFMESLMADPAGPLYRVAAGAQPLVEASRGLDLVHLVGLRAAGARREAEAPAQARLMGRIRSYAAVRLFEQGRAMRLRAQLAPERDGEAAARFFPEASPGDNEAYALPPELELDRVESRYDPIASRLTLGFPRECAAAPEALYAALTLLAGDARVGQVRLAPWPDRSVRASTKLAADL